MSKHWVNAKVGERQRRNVEGHALLTKHGVKMAGYWSSYFVALLWTETKSRSIKDTYKNEWGRYRAIVIDNAWSKKDLVHAKCVTKSGNFERAR